MRDLTRVLGKESLARRRRGLAHRGARRWYLTPCWVACITITDGARLRDHHMSELPDG